jgi:hypothetical protein
MLSCCLASDPRPFPWSGTVVRRSASRGPAMGTLPPRSSLATSLSSALREIGGRQRARPQCHQEPGRQASPTACRSCGPAGHPAQEEEQVGRRTIWGSTERRNTLGLRPDAVSVTTQAQEPVMAEAHPHVENCPGCVADKLAVEDREYLRSTGWVDPEHLFAPKPRMVPPKDTA